MPDGWYDEELLAALGEAVKARQAVPEWFVETGKNAYAWHNIDAELAQLTYDSDGDAGPGRGRPSGRRPPRSGRSRSPRRACPSSSRWPRIRWWARSSRLGPGTLEVHTTGGVTSSPVDEIGCFTVTPIPASPFRLRCRTEDGTDVLTGWITM